MIANDYTPSDGRRLYKLLKRQRVSATTYALPAWAEFEPRIVPRTLGPYTSGDWVTIDFGSMQEMRIVAFWRDWVVVAIPGIVRYGEKVFLKGYHLSQIMIWNPTEKKERAA